MKKSKKYSYLSLAFAIILSYTLSGCTDVENPPAHTTSPPVKSQSTFDKNNCIFTRAENGDLISDSGVAYTAIGSEEGNLHYVGTLEYVGSIQGESSVGYYADMSYQCGLFAISGTDNGNILVHVSPNSEWYAIYRKTSLPAIDLTPEHFARLVFVPVDADRDNNNHTLRGGITDPIEIAAFWDTITGQKSPEEAGLYEKIKVAGGISENCYVCGYIYGCFADEPNLVIKLVVTSFNDRDYAVSIYYVGTDGNPVYGEYVLPVHLFEKLQSTAAAGTHTHS